MKGFTSSNVETELLSFSFVGVIVRINLTLQFTNAPFTILTIFLLSLWPTSTWALLLDKSLNMFSICSNDKFIKIASPKMAVFLLFCASELKNKIIYNKEKCKTNYFNVLIIKKLTWLFLFRLNQQKWFWLYFDLLSQKRYEISRKFH